MAAMLTKLVRDTRGATAIEYALIIACMFLALAIGAGTFGQSLADLWSNNGKLLDEGFGGA